MTLTERVFRKMGWFDTWENSGAATMTVHNYYWNHKDHKEQFKIGGLPPIDSQWEVCAKYLVPFLREKDLAYSIGGETSRLGLYFTWYGSQGIVGQTKIIDDNIALATCEAFMEVELK